MINQQILNNYKGIIDSTLREGLQFRYANFNLTEQKKIIRMLARIGIDRIEVGNPAAEETKITIQALSNLENRPLMLAHVRNKLTDVTQAIEVGVEGINILCTVDRERLAGMGLSLNKYLNDLDESIKLAKNHGLEVRVSVEDFFAQAQSDAYRIFELADALNVDRIGLADTLGSALPWEVAEKVSNVRQKVKADIEVHFHNDLHNAVINSITALRSGANWIDTSLMGIGERTGIPATSVLLGNLYMLNPELIANRYDLSWLTQAENLLAKMMNISVPCNLLTNRENGFVHKAGIHLNAIIKYGPRKYELFPPELIGNKRKLLVGTNISGKTTDKQVKEFNKYYAGS